MNHECSCPLPRVGITHCDGCGGRLPRYYMHLETKDNLKEQLDIAIIAIRGYQDKAENYEQFAQSVLDKYYNRKPLTCLDCKKNKGIK